MTIEKTCAAYDKTKGVEQIFEGWIDLTIPLMVGLKE